MTAITSMKLSRKAGQAILIGPDIVVRVASHGHGHVELVVSAPRDVKILREELRDKPKVTK